ncbi:MAG TPA: hypothetical protein VMC09_15765 [Anaerolineales bacterium]|nr:hypothetical protein [Anaerolineales bacterium]
MSLDEAVNDMKSRITALSKSAEIKVVKMSDEEARISVSVSAAEAQPIRDAALQPTLDYLTKEGLDIQVLVYDKDHPPEVG